jgi:hypothetical protein
MLPALLHQLVKEQMDSSGNESSVILVLLYAAQESGLFPSLLALRLSSYDVAPVTAEHRVRLAASSLSVGEECDIESFHNFGEERFNEGKHFALGGGLAEGHFHSLSAFHSCDIDIQRGLA